MNMSVGKLKRTASIMVKDLELLAALYVAHFIVWRELRRCEKDPVARRRGFNLGRMEV